MNNMPVLLCFSMICSGLDDSMRLKVHCFLGKKDFKNMGFCMNTKNINARFDSDAWVQNPRINQIKLKTHTFNQHKSKEKATYEQNLHENQPV
jgi:hypothetical protein